MQELISQMIELHPVRMYLLFSLGLFLWVSLVDNALDKWFGELRFTTKERVVVLLSCLTPIVNWGMTLFAARSTLYLLWQVLEKLGETDLWK